MIHAMLWTIALAFWIGVGIGVLWLVLAAISVTLDSLHAEWQRVLRDYAMASTEERLGQLAAGIIVVGWFTFLICMGVTKVIDKL